jgi:hypothetical protein
MRLRDKIALLTGAAAAIEGELHVTHVMAIGAQSRRRALAQFIAHVGQHRRDIGTQLGPGGRRGDGGARTAGYPLQPTFAPSRTKRCAAAPPKPIKCRCLLSRQG